ncbi:hydrolase [Mesorhizobium sp. L-8-10]|uniref:alpha/beta fold hydrolase n=1 Tax=Mesorhizobium sp. L-8-10 TaxID=2744523 RepID=UPI00192923FC|nr:alpha/beta hydrolase [Mesorhizobium sp. L-8-10]BCH28197.1 hydrolase [Mesorhizobium sp. L-8-10]
MAVSRTESSGRLVAGGKSLEWAAWWRESAEDAPVIVMLHEGLGCLSLWRGFPGQIADATGLPVFAYSRAGYGQSDPAELPRPPDYMTREAIDVLPAVLDAIGARNYILLGHSDGATIAAIHAGSVGDFRIRGAVLMAPHFFTEPMGLAEIAKAKEAFATTDLRQRMARHHRDPEATFRGWNDAWLDPGFVSWNVADVIDYLRVPVLVIQGEHDQYGTVAQIEEIENRSSAPVDVVLLEDCRHSPQFDQPERTIEAVREFAARLVRIEAAEVVVA